MAVAEEVDPPRAWELFGESQFAQLGVALDGGQREQVVEPGDAHRADALEQDVEEVGGGSRVVERSVTGLVGETQPGRERAELRPELDLTTDLGLDSPNALRLLVELEERLDAEISDDEAAAMNTVGDILEYARSVS